MNPFTALPPNVRAYIYYATFALGVGLGAVQLAYGDGTLPHWLVVALKVLPFVAGGFGITAASNTVTQARRVLVEPVQVQPEAVQAIAAQVSKQLHRDAGVASSPDADR